MFLGEKLLAQYLKQGLQEIADNNALASAALPSLSSSDQEESVQWLNERLAQDQLTIIQGFARRAPTLPQITIIVSSEAEVDEPIGLDMETLPQPGQNSTHWEGVVMQSNYRMLIESNNANTLASLSAFVKFVLLRYRAQLTQDGLYEQVIAMSDLLPAEEFNNPEMSTFQRGVTLTGKHLALYPVIVTKSITSMEIDSTTTFGTGADITEVITLPV